MAYSPVISSDTLADSVAKLNTAFDLLLGMSHAATAPTAPEPWQPWLDTTTSASTLKIRNAANSGWIPMHWLEGQSGPVASDGTNTVKIIGPASLTASYTLTLPNSTELPGSGTRYLLVDSAGTVTFSATGP
jgi:hypothetical protein